MDTEALVGSECSNGDFKYILGVRAVDGGTPQRSDTVNVTLYIQVSNILPFSRKNFNEYLNKDYLQCMNQDLNDFAPVFNSSRYDGSVQEESPAGTQIVVVSKTTYFTHKSVKKESYLMNMNSYRSLPQMVTYVNPITKSLILSIQIRTRTCFLWSRQMMALMVSWW